MKKLLIYLKNNLIKIIVLIAFIISSFLILSLKEILTLILVTMLISISIFFLIWFQNFLFRLFRLILGRFL
jgi:hypothetical protein